MCPKYMYFISPDRKEVRERYVVESDQILRFMDVHPGWTIADPVELRREGLLADEK